MLFQAARDHAQGSPPAGARPPHLRHDRRHPADADPAVRLRDQLRRARPARRRGRRGAHQRFARAGRRPRRDRRDLAAAAAARASPTSTGASSAARSASASSYRTTSNAAGSAGTAQSPSCWSTAPNRWSTPSRAASRPCRCRRAPATTAPRVPVFEVRTEYNPERRTAVQIVSGADRRDPQHDHGDLHRGCDRARARARQPRAADRDADPLVGADGGQAAALRADRPGADHADPDRRACGSSTCRSTAACSTCTSRRRCSSRRP